MRTSTRKLWLKQHLEKILWLLSQKKDLPPLTSPIDQTVFSLGYSSQKHSEMMAAYHLLSSLGLILEVISFL